MSKGRLQALCLVCAAGTASLAAPGCQSASSGSDLDDAARVTGDRGPSLSDAGAGGLSDSAVDRAGDLGVETATPTRAEDRRACQNSCDVVAVAPCSLPNPTCVQKCEALLGEVLCADVTRTALLCQAAAGPGAYVCEIPGLAPVLRDGFCEEEAAAVVNCRREITSMIRGRGLEPRKA